MLTKWFRERRAEREAEFKQRVAEINKAHNAFWEAVKQDTADARSAKRVDEIARQTSQAVLLQMMEKSAGFTFDHEEFSRRVETIFKAAEEIERQARRRRGKKA